MAILSKVKELVEPLGPLPITLAGSSFTGMLSESRKFRLGLVLVMQYIEQLEESVRNALFENVGTLICFRVGPESARYLAPRFAPVFSKEDLMNMGLVRHLFETHD